MVNDLWRDLFDLSTFFWSFPSDPKPPIVATCVGKKIVDLNGKESLPEAVELQMAVAGFKKEDIKVWYEGNTLHVEGSNLHRSSIPSKFQSSFERVFPVEKRLDLTSAETSLEDGILTVKIPIKPPQNNRTYLFGLPKE